MTAARIIPKISRFEKVTSTNNKIREMAERGAGDGTVVIAASQTSGRGSHHREWYSPTGGLYLSALVHAIALPQVTELSILAGAALAQAVATLLPPTKKVSVKWPNDCLVGWKKVGGVLCQVYEETDRPLVIVGIGLNGNIPMAELESFEKNPFSVTSLMAEMDGKELDLDPAAEVVLDKLFTLYQLYQEEGFPPIKDIWEKRCLLLGKKIQLSEQGWICSREEESKDAVVEGTFLGLDEKGAIVLSDSQGDRRHYFSGKITCFWP